MQPENIENEWNLPTDLASYVNRYLSTHISEKDIREKIMATDSIRNNVKGTQKLDVYIKGLLSDNKKLSTLNQENTERYPREGSINFGPLDQTLEYHES